MDLSSSSIFLSGLLVGSFLETKTTLILLGVGLVISNNPLPEIIGGGTPRDIVGQMIIKIIRSGRRFLTDSTEDHISEREKKNTPARGFWSAPTTPQTIPQTPNSIPPLISVPIPPRRTPQ